MVMERRRLVRKVQAVFVCALVLLSGCGRVSPLPLLTATVEPAATLVPTPAIQGTRIPFETIDQAIGGEKISEDSEKNPYLIILTRADDTGELEGLVSEAAMGRLGDIYFDRQLVIAVFQGWKPTWGYAIQVQWVIKNNGEIVVIADIKNPPKDSIVQQEETSPYHLIRISREDLDGISKFTLNANGESIFQIEKTVD